MHLLSGPRRSPKQGESPWLPPKAAVPQNTEEIGSLGTARRGRVRNPDFRSKRANIYGGRKGLFSGVPDLFWPGGRRVGENECLS